MTTTLQMFPAGVPACGPDALRLGLLANTFCDNSLPGATGTRAREALTFVAVDMDVFVRMRNFVTKMKNGTRLVLSAYVVMCVLVVARICFRADTLCVCWLYSWLGADSPRVSQRDFEQLSTCDRWILSRLNECTVTCLFRGVLTCLC